MDFQVLRGEALSPLTDPARLRELAANYPELRGDILQNPSIYPELAEWINTVGAPAPPLFAAPTNGVLAQPQKSKVGMTALVASGIVCLVAVGLVLGIGLTKWWNSSESTASEVGGSGISTDSGIPLRETGVDRDVTPIDLRIHQIDSFLYPRLTIYFSANAKGGDPLSVLDKSDLEIFYEDVPVTGLYDFKQPGEQRPISISLVVDVSDSMEGVPLRQAQDSVLTFLDYVDFEGGDRVELAEFGTDAYVVLPYSQDIDLLAAGVNSRQTAGMTALFDAAYNAVVRAYAQPGQKAVVIFTDGQENSSVHTVEEVISLSLSTGIPIYLVGVGGETDTHMLEYLARETGGSYFSSPTAADLGGIYKEVYDSEKGLYSVSFEAASTDVAPTAEIMLNVVSEKYSGDTTKTFSAAAGDQLPLELLYSGISASSTLAAQPSDLDGGAIFEYLPYHAFDGAKETTWAEASNGDGVGEWLQIDFARATPVSGFEIMNGYWRLDQRLFENNRVKRIRVDFSDGESEEFTLADPVSGEYQPTLTSSGERLAFAKTHLTTDVRFTILEVYPGNRWNDTCITNISLFR